MSDSKKQRNKRIAELQKKNKEISEANKNNSAQILALIIKNGLLEKQNKELQEQIEKMKNCKENAELKELIKSEHEIEARKNNRLISQLLKVKEIIKNLIDDLTTIDGEEIRELKAVKEAEQFLNSENILEEKENIEDSKYLEELVRLLPNSYKVVKL